MRVKASNVTEKSEIDKAPCETYEKAKEWDKLMSTARRLESAKFLHEEGFRYFLKGATKAEKWKELEAEARAVLAANADHVIAMRAMAVTRLKQNDAAGAQDWVKKLTGSKFAGRDEYIFATWFEIGQDKIDVSRGTDSRILPITALRTKSTLTLSRSWRRCSAQPTRRFHC
jgi:hypothetical protein